jgi:hypothetical protein
MRDPASYSAPPGSETMRAFLLTILNGKAGECLRVGRVNEAYKRATIALVASDVPLDRHFRLWLAVELARLYSQTPTQRRKYERRAQDRSWARVLKKLHARMRASGLPALQAEEKNANMLGISVDALRKRMQRAKTK